MMTRFAVCLLSAAVMLVAQQQPATKTIAERLASTEPADLAWGAYLAGNESRQDLTGELLRLVVHPDRRVRLAAFDALLRLDVAIPEETLTAMAANRLDEVLIVIGRHPGKYGRLIGELLRREMSDPYWVALHSILAETPPAGFAAMVLREWTIRLTIVVRDQNPVDHAGRFSVTIENGTPLSSAGFPPLVVYSIMVDSQLGAVLLAKGPHPVGYSAQKILSRVVNLNVDRDAYRADYLAYLIGETPFPISDPLRINWQSESDFRTQASGLLRYASKTLTLLKNRLVERRLLDPSEAKSISPKLDVRVVDRRKVQTPALPVMNWVLL